MSTSVNPEPISARKTLRLTLFSDSLIRYMCTVQRVADAVTEVAMLSFLITRNLIHRFLTQNFVTKFCVRNHTKFCVDLHKILCGPTQNFVCTKQLLSNPTIHPNNNIIVVEFIVIRHTILPTRYRHRRLK